MNTVSLSNLPRRIYVLATAVLFGLLGTYLLAASHASGSATLTLSPASSSVSLGSNITVTVVENSGSTAVNAVETDLTYDQTKLQFVSINTSTSPFSLVAASSGGSGKVTIANATSTPVTGQQTVATVTFTAIGLGSTPVGLAATSGIAQASDSTDVLGTTTGATYTVNDQTTPSTPTGLAAGTRTATSIAFSWTASTDNVGVTGYKIYRGGTQIATTSSTNYTNTGLSPGNNYSYTVAAYDAAGNTSAQSTALATSTTPDNTAPSVPSGLTAGTKTITSIAFSWTASTDNVGVTGYKIYRGGTQVGTSTSTSYTDTGLTPNTGYSYTVLAYDAAGNTSAASAASSFSTLTDSTAPSVPTNLGSAGQTTTSVTLSWTASTDNYGVTGYKIYRNSTQIGTSSTTKFTDTGLTPGTTYSYTVAAYDAAGNTSAKSTAKALAPLLVPGDADGDGHVTYLDLSILASTYQGTTDLRADFNHDGIVNYLDLSTLAANWGK